MLGFWQGVWVHVRSIERRCYPILVFTAALVECSSFVLGGVPGTRPSLGRGTRCSMAAGLRWDNVEVASSELFY